MSNLLKDLMLWGETAYVSAEFISTDKLRSFSIFKKTAMSFILSNDL